MNAISLPNINLDWNTVKETATKAVHEITRVALIALKGVATLRLYHLFPDLFFTGVVVGFAFPEHARSMRQGVDDVLKALNTPLKRAAFVVGVIFIGTLHFPACAVTLNLYASSQIGAFLRERVTPKIKLEDWSEKDSQDLHELEGQPLYPIVGGGKGETPAEAESK